MPRSFWSDLPKPFFCLAPMADVTDAAFRYIIARYSKYGGQDIGEYGKFTRPPLGTVGGPDILWTEFVSADGLFKGGYDALINDLQYDEPERPIVAQFFSKEPELMARAAELAEELGFDGVDINMGCPDRSVCKQGAGAAMIQTPKLAQEIIRMTKKATRLPVSVKTRIGYNENELDTWLPALLEAEPVAVALHARTKKEMSKVPAHWEEITRAVEIRDRAGSTTLIIGNGDVEDMADARRRAEETGADGIMLGRAIFGNPWLFSNLARARRGRQIENPAPILPRGEERNHTYTRWSLGGGATQSRNSAEQSECVAVDISRKIGARANRPPLAERLQVLHEHLMLFQELLPHKSFYLMKKHFKSYLKGDGYDKKFLMRLMDTSDVGDAGAIVTERLAG